MWRKEDEIDAFHFTVGEVIKAQSLQKYIPQNSQHWKENGRCCSKEEIARHIHQL